MVPGVVKPKKIKKVVKKPKLRLYTDAIGSSQCRVTISRLGK